MIENIKNKALNFIKNNERTIFIIICILLTFIIVLILIFKKFDNVKAEESKEESISILEEVEESSSQKQIIRVDIKGAVSKPGVYSLEEGSIVDDVIKLAGGVNKNANTKEINLSKKLKDEMVIVIYTNSEIQEFKSKQEESNKKECICDKDINDVCVKESYSNYYSFNSNVSNNSISYSKQESKESVNNLININTASLEELLSLPGVGESKAKAIIEYRKENKFNVIEDIMKVSGIGQSVFDKIKENITV